MKTAKTAVLAFALMFRLTAIACADELKRADLLEKYGIDPTVLVWADKARVEAETKRLEGKAKEDTKRQKEQAKREAECR